MKEKWLPKGQSLQTSASVHVQYQRATASFEGGSNGKKKK